MRSAWQLWRARERQLEERVRLLETQVQVLSARLVELDRHAMKKQFARVK